MNLKDQLIKARIQLILDRPFYGNLALHLPLEEASYISTFATDGKCILYNKEFAESCNDEDKQFILCHEICHVIFHHCFESRRGEREGERWNFAIDYATNAILKKDFGYVPEGGLYEEKFENMTAEEIYNKLPEMNGKGKGKGGYRIYQKGDITIEIDGKGNITVNGKKIKPFDTHQQVKGSEEEIDELEKEWTIQVAKAYQQAKMAGILPAGMNIFIESLLQPKLDWRTMMKQFLITTAKSDFRWFPPSRRYIHNDMYMPSITDESLGDVVVVIDNSRSTLDAQQKFFSECNGLLQQYDMDMHLIVCDVNVNFYKVYNKGDIIELKHKGGGGTEMKNAWTFIDKKMIDPSVVVCLTDGYTDLKFTSKYPTLWVLCKDSIDIKNIPFGIGVKMKD